MAIPARVIRDLPKLTWRGLFAPCESAPVDFSHAQVLREQYGIDDGWHDPAGRKPLDMKVRLHFINTQFDGVVWFPNEYNKWQAALFDGSPGKLRHPILGEMDAVPISGTIQLEARQSGGVTVDVTFQRTLIDVTKPSSLKTAQVDVKAVAKQVLVDAGNLGIHFPSGRLDGDLLDAIDSFLGDLTSATMTITGLGNQIVGGIEDMIFRVELLTDPTVAPVYDNLVLLWDSVRVRTSEIEKLAARSTAGKNVAADTSWDKFGTEYNNSVEDLLSLNPGLLRYKIIPAGSLVTYYTGK
jgi:hypothetical protein